MGEIAQKYIELAKKRNPGEPEFIQTVEEVLTSIEPVLKAHPEYEKAGLIERLIEPERGISFRVSWVDDSGKVQVNRGYRYQFNSALGPYKGGLRFAPSVYPGIMKFLGFEQIFKNSLTGLPIGGAKGGSDFDPNGKSDMEVMRFCQAYMTELYRHIGAEIDVPAGDLGVGAREIGYLFGQYKRITKQFEGVLTGKGIPYGGLLGRTEATGYGIVFFAREVLAHEGESLKGKTCVVSGFGNVAWGTVKKLNELGAKVIAISGPDGYILDESEDGVSGEKCDYMLELRASGKNIVKPYADKFGEAGKAGGAGKAGKAGGAGKAGKAGGACEVTFVPGKKPWGIKADLYFPCATQNEILLDDAREMVANGCRYLIEGSNMPTTNEAVKYLQANGVIVAPSKAVNAGGVSCSCIEMGQNAGHTVFSPEEVYEKLESIMVNIHKASAEAAERYGLGYDLVKGANIAGFEKVAKAMMAQGIV